VRDNRDTATAVSVYTGEERRSSPRVDVRGISTYINVLSTTLPFPVINLSARGAFVHVTDPMPIGVLMGLQLFRVGRPIAFSLRARVVWAASAKAAQKRGCLPGVRLRFEPMPPDAANSLKKLLAEFGMPEEFQNPETTKEHSNLLRQKPDTDEVGPVVLGEEVSFMEFVPKEEEKTRLVATAEQHRLASIPAKSSGQSTAADSRLFGRISRLTDQLQEFQKLVERQDRELNNLRQRLLLKEEELVKAEKSRRAAELAVRRLSIQLAAFRR